MSDPSDITPAAPPKKKRPLWWRALVMLGIVIGGFFLFLVGFLALYQSKMIYHPRPYDPIETMRLPERMTMIEYEIPDGKQTAFYFAPEEKRDEPPAFLWVYFNGNASTALNWLDIVETYPEPTHGHLLIDYPGYGLNEGEPSPHKIKLIGAAALSALAQHLNTNVPELEDDMGTLGHSLGAASALIFANEHPVRKVILISPFTSMLDMAKLVVGWPLNNVLMHRYDNVARLKELAQRNPPPQIIIFHGTQDQVIPVQMSRDLSAAHPDLIIFYESEKADHNWIVDIVKPQLYEEMANIAP